MSDATSLLQDDLLELAREAVRRCSPDLRTAAAIGDWGVFCDGFDVLAIGKCAAGMMEGISRDSLPARRLTIVPHGYPRPASGDVLEGAHPLPDAGSFAAGDAALAFARNSDRPVLLLLSGGGSACAESPVDGVTRGELLEVWGELLRSGLPIEEVNEVRRRMSAIKGGGLGRLMPQGSIVLIHSDVPYGRERDVASSPAFPDRDDALLEKALAKLSPATQGIVVRAASKHRDLEAPPHPWRVTASSKMLVDETVQILRGAGRRCRALHPDALDEDVESLAVRMAQEAWRCAPGEIIVAGGEPQVPVRGTGRGGRCSELAVRLAREAVRRGRAVRGLALATDGVDGSSGLAGVQIDPSRWGDRASFLEAVEEGLERSDTARLAERVGGPVIMSPGGNNLRDLLLLAGG